MVLVDDHALFAESLELALEMQGYDVHRIHVLEVTSMAALVTQVVRKRPQVWCCSTSTSADSVKRPAWSRPSPAPGSTW